MSARSRVTPSSAGVYLADGYGIAVRVRHGRLIVSDGIGRNRREHIFPRIGSNLSRLVVLGSAGHITFEALRWLNDIGAAFVQLDRNGELVMTSARLGLDDPRLRRLQSRSAETWVGVEIAREIMRRKLTGQAAVLSTLEQASQAHEIIEWARRDLEAATSLSEIRTAESQGALAYWGALASLAVRFSKADARRVPAHWLTVGTRGSPLSGSPRLAVTPFHALTNYLYALLEAEARLACLACGLDPGLGIIHADQKARDSLALDVMEAVRPTVDAYLVELVRERTFRARDFHETRQGSCRVLAPLTHTLAETTPTWRAQVAPVAETVARMLATSTGARIERSLTPLTQANRRAAHPRLGNRKRRAPTPPPAELPSTCRTCGAELPSSGRRFCDDCLPEIRTEAFKEAGPAALARLAAEGRDPSHGGDAGRKRGSRVSDQLRASHSWSGSSVVDPGEFRREILPLIRDVPLSRLVEATGLSLRYCSMIRRGERVPHPRHWNAFRRSPTGLPLGPDDEGAFVGRSPSYPR